MENPGDSIYKGFNLDDLNIDQFYLNIGSDPNVQEFFLYSSHKECFECPYARVWVNNFEKLIQKTHNKFRISFTDSNYLYESNGHHCDFDNNFGEFGIYNITVQQDGCSLTTVKEPVNIYLSILTVIGIYILFFGLVAITSYVYHVYTSGEDDTSAKKPKKQRVLSIDTFRGISIAVMIFVNFGAGGYDLLEHAVWNGLHLADLAFPWFMWIMGFCIPISLSSNFAKNVSNLDMLKNILKRSIKLYALGLFLGSGDILSKMRLFGVLQRFGIVYLIVSVICIFCMNRNATERAKSGIDDIKKLFKAWIVVLIILVVYILLLVFLTKEGCPKFYLGPGGLYKNMSHPNCTGGATGYVDEVILGDHTYQFPTIYEVYEARPFDPEGILGCLPTIFHVFLGVQAGTTLLVYKSHRDRLIRWLSWAVVTGAIAGGLCGWSKEGGLIPVNKNLWSISFVMVTTCFALVVLSVCYILIDIKKWWSGKPFLYAGMNAILMYIGHSMTDGYFPIRWYLEDTRRTHFLCLVADVWGAGIWIFISYYLYKINYFFVI